MVMYVSHAHVRDSVECNIAAFEASTKQSPLHYILSQYYKSQF